MGETGLLEAGIVANGSAAQVAVGETGVLEAVIVADGSAIQVTVGASEVGVFELFLATSESWAV